MEIPECNWGNPVVIGFAGLSFTVAVLEKLSSSSVTPSQQQTLMVLVLVKPSVKPRLPALGVITPQMTSKTSSLRFSQDTDQGQQTRGRSRTERAA